MSRGLEISVVVAARDSAPTLPRLLASLRAQTLAGGAFEVVVVDNGSGDDTAAVARSEGAIVVSEPCPNRALARNRGIDASSAPLVAFTDSDCEARPGWLEALASCLARRPLAAGPVVLGVGDPPNAVERFECLWRFPQERYVREGGFAATANLGARREALDAIDGFDPAYRHIGEDVDLCLRAGAAGHELGFCAEAVVSHPGETSLPPVLRRGFAQGFSAQQLVRRLDGRTGHSYWRHPGPLARGDWALRNLGVDPRGLAPGERRRMLAIARVEYGARVAGSAWAALTRAG